MSGDQIVGGAAALLCLTLVGSALLSRRLPAGKMLRLAAIWALIIAALVGVIRFLNIT